MPPNINYLFICFDLGTPSKARTNITKVSAFFVDFFWKIAKCERTTQQLKKKVLLI